MQHQNGGALLLPTTQTPFKVRRRKVQPSSLPAVMFFASFFSPSGAGRIKSHFPCPRAQPKPARPRNPLQRGSGLTYPFHPEPHSESPASRAAAPAAPGDTLLTHPPAQGPTQRPWSEASLGLHLLCSKKAGVCGCVMGEKAQIPPGPSPRHSHRLQHLDENSHQVLAAHTGDASGELMALGVYFLHNPAQPAGRAWGWHGKGGL